MITNTSSTNRSTLQRVALAACATVAIAACSGGSDAADEPTPTAAAAEVAEESAAAPEADNVEPAGSADALIATGATADGDVITDAAGLSLYGFTPDVGGSPTCTDGCAQAWPPFTVDGDSLPADLDASVFSVVTHPDGSTQLAAGGWPLYYFAGDATAGDINGQGSGGEWFLAAPDGSLVGATE